MSSTTLAHRRIHRRSHFSALTVALVALVACEAKPPVAPQVVVAAAPVVDAGAPPTPDAGAIAAAPSLTEEWPLATVDATKLLFQIERAAPQKAGGPLGNIDAWSILSVTAGFEGAERRTTLLREVLPTDKRAGFAVTFAPVAPDSGPKDVLVCIEPVGTAKADWRCRMWELSATALVAFEGRAYLAGSQTPVSVDGFAMAGPNPIPQAQIGKELTVDAKGALLLLAELGAVKVRMPLLLTPSGPDPKGGRLPPRFEVDVTGEMPVEGGELAKTPADGLVLVAMKQGGVADVPVDPEQKVPVRRAVTSFRLGEGGKIERHGLMKVEVQVDQKWRWVEGDEALKLLGVSK